jgi:putative ABC transport system permease protein
MLQDLRYAARALRRAPGWTLAVVATLAFGLGATIAIFTAAYGVLIRPLPYHDPDRLVVLLHDGTHPVSPADYFDYRRELGTLSTLSAAQFWQASLTGSGQPERLRGLQVSADLFETLGVPALAGRTFEAGEDAAGRTGVVILSHALWTRRFATDPRIVGRTILLDHEPHLVVGVMPARFQFAPFWATRAELWKPLSLASRLDDRGGRSLRLFGRLAPGATLASAQAEASTVAARLAADHPDTNTRLGISVVPLHEKSVGPVKPLFAALTSMAGLLLLIACANVSGLLLARASARQREVAVRTALGAGGARLARHLLAESAILSAAGGAAGLLIAGGALAWLESTLPPGSLPRQHEFEAGTSLFFIALGLTVLTALLCGLAPLAQLRRLGLAEILKDSPRAATEGRDRMFARRALIAAQMALALAIVAGAALMGRTILSLRAVDAGFDPEGVLTATVSLSGTPHISPESRIAFFDRLAAGIERLPGVASVSAINHLPLAGDLWRLTVEIEGRPAPPPDERIGAAYRVVRPGYFETMRLRLRSGRDFTDADRAGAVPVVVVNSAMASRYWPGESPLGRRIRLGDDLLTIVGVAADARQEDWTASPGEEIYLPYAQRAGGMGGASLTWVIRSHGDPAALVPTVQRAVWQMDPSLPVSDMATMKQIIGDELWRSRASAALMAAFATVALAISALGMYGIVVYTVSRRAREIGIRLALGARAADVVRLAAREALVPAVAGVLLGLPLALLLTRSMAALLYGVPPDDTGTFALTAAGLTAVALAASAGPAVRAGRVDPVVSLRSE